MDDADENKLAVPEFWPTALLMPVFSPFLVAFAVHHQTLHQTYNITMSFIEPGEDDGSVARPGSASFATFFYFFFDRHRAAVYFYEHDV
jgi:hypothetical protein